MSYGALIGNVDTTQMILMAAYEAIFYALNEYIVLKQIKGLDTGGGIVLHIFGAYFGLAATYFYAAPVSKKDKANNSTNYSSNVYALIGTTSLWVCWPAFNSIVLDEPSFKNNAIVNTMLSLFGSTVGVYIATSVINRNKFNMVSIVNATLAGGVVIGTCCAVLKYPGVALLFGLISGVVSCLGFEYLSNFLETRIKLRDNAGIHNLHGMPGLLSGIFSIFVIAFENQKDVTVNDYFTTNEFNAAGQVYSILCTLAIAIVSGAVFGIFLKYWKWISIEKFYVDEEHWVECNSAELNKESIIENQVELSQSRETLLDR